MTDKNDKSGLFSRRAFTAAAATAGAAMALNVRAAEEPKKKRDWKKGVMIGMAPGKTLLEKFENMKAAGFEAVELDAPGAHKLEEVNEAKEKTGIIVEGVVDRFHWNITLTDPREKTRATAVEHLKNALRDCKAFGGTSVLLVPGVVNKGVGYADAWKRAQEEIAKAIPTAQETGVKIAIENVWNNFIISPVEAAKFVDEFNSPWVGWHLDLGNLGRYGWQEHWVRALNKRILKLHIKEFSQKNMMEKGMWKGFDCELLKGDNDWPATMKALDEVGYSGWATVEMGGDLKKLSAQLDEILAS